MLNRKISFAILFLLMLNTVQAIGITPAVKIIEFKPSTKQTIKFNVYNNENKAFNAKIEIRGELSKYFELEKDIVYIPADKKLTPFNIILNMPEKLEKPGFHTTEIIVTKEPLTSIEAGNTQIGTKPSVIAKLNIIVPYPGKYVEARLVIESSEKDARFVIPIFNYGTESTDVTATINIYDKDKIADITTNKIFLERDSQGKLEAKWSGKKGNYDVVANVNYSGEIIKLTGNFNIGRPFINITRVAAKTFKFRGISNFNIFLSSQWNKKIENVYGELSLNKENKELVKSKTASILLLPNSEEKLDAYLDLSSILEGEYTLKFTLYYDKQTTEKTLNVKITENSIVLDRITTYGVKIRNRIILSLSILLTILIIITIIIFIRSKRKHR